MFGSQQTSSTTAWNCCRAGPDGGSITNAKVAVSPGATTDSVKEQARFFDIQDGCHRPEAPSRGAVVPSRILSSGVQVRVPVLRIATSTRRSVARSRSDVTTAR